MGFDSYGGENSTDRNQWKYTADDGKLFIIKEQMKKVLIILKHPTPFLLAPILNILMFQLPLIHTELE